MFVFFLCFNTFKHGCYSGAQYVMNILCKILYIDYTIIKKKNYIQIPVEQLSLRGSKQLFTSKKEI